MIIIINKVFDEHLPIIQINVIINIDKYHNDKNKLS